MQPRVTLRKAVEVIANDPNVAIWASDRYRRTQRVAETARTVRAGQEKRENPAQAQCRRRRQEREEPATGGHLDTVV